MKRLKSGSFTRSDVGILLVGMILALGALAAFGRIAKITTSRTEKIESHTTTTKRIPMPSSTKTTRETTRIRTIVRQEISALRPQLQDARAAVATEVRSYCLAHDHCKGRTGVHGLNGSNGTDGTDGKDVTGSRPPPAHQLDSSILDGVDNRVTDLENGTSALLARIDSLTGRIGVLENLLGLVCRVLHPTRVC